MLPTCRLSVGSAPVVLLRRMPQSVAATCAFALPPASEYQSNHASALVCSSVRGLPGSCHPSHHEQLPLYNLLGIIISSWSPRQRRSIRLRRFVIDDESTQYHLLSPSSLSFLCSSSRVSSGASICLNTYVQGKFCEWFCPARKEAQICRLFDCATTNVQQ